MRRFILFGGSDYYPRGGWNDLVGRYETERAALIAATGSPDGAHFDWWHIIDAETGQRVADSSERKTWET